MLFKVINLFNRKQAIYSLQIAEGKTFFKQTDLASEDRRKKKISNEEALNQKTENNMTEARSNVSQ